MSVATVQEYTHLSLCPESIFDNYLVYTRIVWKVSQPLHVTIDVTSSCTCQLTVSETTF